MWSTLNDIHFEAVENDDANGSSTTQEKLAIVRMTLASNGRSMQDHTATEDASSQFTVCHGRLFIVKQPMETPVDEKSVYPNYFLWGP